MKYVSWGFFMRKAFRGFYSDDHKLEEVFASENVCFIFDTSVLLNMYQFKDETRTEFFALLDKIQDKIWIPYHVALEYQRNRVGVISREKKRFSQVENKIEDIKKLFKEIKEDELLKRIPKLSEHAQSCESELNATLGKYKTQLTNWNKKQPEVRSNDNIRKRITELFDGRVGGKPEEEWLKKVQKDGEERFKHDIPPGYCDKKKDRDKGKKPTFKYAELTYERKFGDLIAWKQIIQFVLEHSKIKEVVFITDDGKEDWLYTVKSNGKKAVGVRSELREEICEFGEIEHFSLVNSSQFLELASKVFDVEVAADSIADITERVLPNQYKSLNSFYKLLFSGAVMSAAAFAAQKKQDDVEGASKLDFNSSKHCYFEHNVKNNLSFNNVKNEMLRAIGTIISSPEFVLALEENVGKELHGMCTSFVANSLRESYGELPKDKRLEYAISLVRNYK